MFPFPELHLPQSRDARRAQTFFLVGLSTILLLSLAIAVNAFQSMQAGSAASQASTIGPAVYGWLPAPHVPATNPDADLGGAIAGTVRTGPAVYGWLPDETDTMRTGPAVYGWLPDETDTMRTGPAVYGWLPDTPEGH